jgi:phosphoribosyl-ATP pyrophosphohydrolase
LINSGCFFCEAAAMNAMSPVTPLTMPASKTSCAELPPDHEIEKLYDALDHVSWNENPRTARLLASSLRKKSQKVVEEAAEVALETVRRRKPAAVRESVDLIYHLVVLWHACGIKPEQVWAEMRRRADAIGIAEKLPKRRDERHRDPDSLTSFT